MKLFKNTPIKVHIISNRQLSTTSAIGINTIITTSAAVAAPTSTTTLLLLLPQQRLLLHTTFNTTTVTFATATTFATCFFLSLAKKHKLSWSIVTQPLSKHYLRRKIWFPPSKSLNRYATCLKILFKVNWGIALCFQISESWGFVIIETSWL